MVIAIVQGNVHHNGGSLRIYRYDRGVRAPNHRRSLFEPIQTSFEQRLGSLSPDHGRKGATQQVLGLES